MCSMASRGLVKTFLNLEASDRRAGSAPRGSHAISAIGRIVSDVDCARPCQETVDLVIVSLEGIAHDEKIAAVARDGIPVDDAGEIAVLEEGNGAGAAGCACVSRRDVHRAGTANTVVPI